MDKYENRRLRLKELVAARFDGKASKLAAAIERQPDYVSRCMSEGKHRKRIGEDFAAHIAATLALPADFFDQRVGTAILTAPHHGAEQERLQYNLERQHVLQDFDALPDGMKTYAAEWLTRLRLLCDSFSPVVRQVFRPPRDPVAYVEWERDLAADMVRLQLNPPAEAPPRRHGDHPESVHERSKSQPR